MPIFESIEFFPLFAYLVVPFSFILSISTLLPYKKKTTMTGSSPTSADFDYYHKTDAIGPSNLKLKRRIFL